MTAVEDAFRRVLAARLPAGPGWTAWIDGTVQELAASMPADPRLTQIRSLCDAIEAGGYGVPMSIAKIKTIRQILDAPVEVS